MGRFITIPQSHYGGCPATGGGDRVLGLSPNFRTQTSIQLGYLQMAMDQYLYIPFLGGWTSIYQLFWCSPGVQGFDTLPNDSAYCYCWFLTPNVCSQDPLKIVWPLQWWLFPVGEIPENTLTNLLIWEWIESYIYIYIHTQIHAKKT